MAGIGFSLRKILNHDSLTRVAAAYAVAGIICGGPWLIAVMGIILLSVLVAVIPAYHQAIAQFQITITYLVAGSLILSGFAGNSFSRYVSDQLFLNRPTYIIPNLNGMMLVLTILSGALAFLMVLFLFPKQDIFFRAMFMGSFVVLCNIWVVISLLTGLKDYKIILLAFFSGYALIVGLSYTLRSFGLDAFMFGFLLGHLVLLLILLIAIYQEYISNAIIDFHFLKKNAMFKILIFSGFFFNLAIWIDKFVFWFNPTTSYPVIGFLRASWIYDLPIFIAYLCLLPGMAVFLLLMETNFSDYYTRFNESIRRGKSLSYITVAGEQMITYAFNVIYSIIKIQAITIIMVFQFGAKILSALHISLLYINLLYVAVIGTSLQIVLLAIINILYYMDRRVDILVISIAFFILNFIFTVVSIYLGPFYYGFGFTGALAIVCIYGMYLLSEEFTNLEYKVIMLRGGTNG